MNESYSMVQSYSTALNKEQGVRMNAKSKDNFGHKQGKRSNKRMMATKAQKSFAEQCDAIGSTRATVEIWVTKHP